MKATSSRSYHSPRREAAARATRQAVLDGAEAVFVARGYPGATLGAIAEAGGVSLATVKLVAPTKAALLLEAFRARVRGDAADEPLERRRAWQEMLGQEDPGELVARWVRLTRQAHEGSAALYEVVSQAAGSAPELAEVESRGAAGRRQSYTEAISALAALGALRPDLDVEAAVDIAWVLNSPRTFGLFSRCGWTPDRWEEWMAEAMRAQLLKAG